MGFETMFANKSMLSNKVKLVYSLFRPTVMLPSHGHNVVVRGSQGILLFSFRGRFLDVPATFAFPAGVKRDVG
jgi:hypothetical protein